MPEIFVLAIAAGACVCTLAGGTLALRLRDRLHLILGFSAGAMVALAFFDLLPEAIRLGQGILSPGTVLAIAAAGFFAYTVLDRAILLHVHREEESAHARSDHRHWLGAASLSAHSVIDGFAIAIGFRAAPAIGIVVAAAVLAHDFSDGVNTVNVVLAKGGAPRAALRWLITDAVAPVAGAAIGLAIGLPKAAIAPVLGFFAGLFLYLGASDLLPESFHAHPRFLTTVLTLAGAALLYVVIRLAGS